MRATTEPIPVRASEYRTVLQPVASNVVPLETANVNTGTDDRSESHTYVDLPPVLTEYTPQTNYPLYDPTYEQQVTYHTNYAGAHHINERNYERYDLTSSQTYDQQPLNMNQACGASHQDSTAPQVNQNRCFIPSVNTVSSLKKQLNKLEAQNLQLRQENQKRYEELQNLAQTAQLEMQAKIASIEKAFLQNYDRRPSSPATQPSASGFTSPCHGHLLTSHREFKDPEKLRGNTNFKEWSRAITTELQVLGILQTIWSELGATAPWSSDIRLRADTIAHSLFTWSVDTVIQSQINSLPTAFQMWTLLNSQYNVTSTFEQPRLLTQFERLSFRSAGSALGLIRQSILIRDKYNSIIPDLPEKYWVESVLRKLLPYYQFETQLLMQQKHYTLELVDRYFTEFVFDSAEPGKNNTLGQIAALSDFDTNFTNKNLMYKFMPNEYNRNNNTPPRFNDNKQVLPFTYPGNCHLRHI